MDLSTLLFPISHRGEMGMQIFLSKPILGVGEHIQTSFPVLGCYCAQ